MREKIKIKTKFYILCLFEHSQGYFRYLPFENHVFSRYFIRFFLTLTYDPH